MNPLTPDPAVPRRDALLRPLTMAGVLSRRLHAGVPVERCERTYVKYRVGESLRVVYRYEISGEPQHAAIRSGRSGCTLWPFPHDRKLAALPALAPGSPVLERLLGTSCTPRLVAYAAEQSASAACLDDRGRVLAYAKVQRDGGERRGCAALAGHDVRVPRVLADEDGVLLLEALTGARIDAPALRAFGRTLATLHATVPPPRERFQRLDPHRLATAAATIARAQPDVEAAAETLLARLVTHEDDAHRRAVCLHGDANLRNALVLPSGEVALLDLEHVAAGPAAADVGQILAAVGTRHAAALLAGYAEIAPPPDRAALRWHTAASILARQALPAISRFRPLTDLRTLLATGADLLAT
ncbi:MAG TPA: phosphotransferase [Solirubrobacter sp.]|nr:phosphotransferase [Solirubrobacter sp.]